MIRHAASSIPPQLQKDRFGTLSIIVKKFVVNDQRKCGASVCSRISMWGQESIIDVDIRDVERGCVLVEYPLVGSIQIVRCYLADMGVLVLPIVEEGCILGQANLSLLQILDGLVGTLAEFGNSNALESSTNVTIPLLSLPSETELGMSFQCYEFGEMHIEVKLEVKNERIRIDGSDLYVTPKGKKELEHRRQSGHVGGMIPHANNLTQYSRSTKEQRGNDNGYVNDNSTIALLDDANANTDDDGDTNINRWTCAQDYKFRIKTATKTSIDCEFDMSYESCTLATEDDSILLNAMLPVHVGDFPQELSPLQREFSNFMTSKQRPASKCLVDLVMEEKTPQRHTIFPSLPTHEKEYTPCISSVRVASLRIETMSISSTSIQPLLCHIKDGICRVQVWLECDAPPLVILLPDQAGVTKVSLIDKIVGKEKQKPRFRSSAAQMPRRHEEVEAQKIKSDFQGLHNISHTFLWNLQFHSDEHVKLWLRSSVHLNIYATVERLLDKKDQGAQLLKSAKRRSSKQNGVPTITSASNVKLGEAQINLDSLLSRRNMTIDFGPKSDANTLNIQFCLRSGAACTEHDELPHHPDEKEKELNHDLSSLDLVDDTIISGISGPSSNVNAKSLSPTSNEELIQGSDKLSSECETKTIAAESYPLWVHLCVVIIDLMTRFTHEEKDLFVTIKVHYRSNTHNKKDETVTIVDETITINRGTRALSRTFMLKSGKQNADTGTIQVQIRVRAVCPSQPKNPSQQNLSIECIEEICIPLRAANRALTPDDPEIISHLNTTGEGVLSATVAVGSLKCIKSFANQMQCATRIQKFWKCARYNKRSPQQLVRRTIHKTVQDLSLNAELLTRGVLLIQRAWRNKGFSTPNNLPFLQNQLYTENYPQSIIRSQRAPTDEEKGKSTDKSCIDSNVIEPAKKLSTRSLESEKEVLENCASRTIQEIEISFQQCSGIRELVTLWADGILGKELNIPFSFNEQSWVESGFLLTFSLLARSKTKATSKPEMTYFASCIKGMDSVARHQVSLNETFQIAIDDSEHTLEYLRSEMMLCKLWYIPSVTDIMIGHKPPSRREEEQLIPQMSKLLCITKCPLSALVGADPKSYLCPWYLAHTNPTEAIGKIQITLRPNGCDGEPSSVINLGSVQESASAGHYPAIFDWDLPDKIEAEMSRPKEKEQAHVNSTKKEDISVLSNSFRESFDRSNDDANRRDIVSEPVQPTKIISISPQMEGTSSSARSTETPSHSCSNIVTKEIDYNAYDPNAKCSSYSAIVDNGDSRPTPGEKLPRTMQQTIPIPPSKPVLNRDDLNTNLCIDYKSNNSDTTFQMQAIEGKLAGDDAAAAAVPAAAADDDDDDDDDDGEGKYNDSFADSKPFTNQEIKSRHFARFDNDTEVLPLDTSSEIYQPNLFAESKAVQKACSSSSDESSSHSHIQLGKRRRRRRGHSSSPLSLASSSSSDSYSRFDAFPRAALLRTSDVIGDEETSRYRHDHYPSTDDSSGSSSLNKAGTKDVIKQTLRGSTNTEYDTDGSTYSSDSDFSF